MRKCFIVLLILVLPALLAACFPAAGVGTLSQPSATGLATMQPALAPGTAAAATGTAEGTGSSAGGAGSTPGPAPLPISGTLTLSGTTPALEGATPMSEPTGSAAGGPPPAVTAAIAGVAQQLDVRPNALTLIVYEAVDWPDACLGIVVPGVMCAQVVTPGYRIVLRGPQGEFEVHTAAAGTSVRILKPGTTGGSPSTAPAPTPPPVAPSATPAPANASGASGIEGLVTIGPITPTSQEGQSNSRPYQATINVLDQSGQVVTRFGTNARGLFRVALAPGTYVIRPESAGRFPRAAQQTVRVLKGTFVKIDIEYDSGIR
jgi:hypothetical protein